MAKHPTMKNITQPYPTAFQVRVVKEGKEKSRLFSFSHWGGKKKALAAANSWRDQLKVVLKLNDKRVLTVPKNNLSTGIRGISRSVHTDYRKGLKYLVYSVCWIDSIGKKRNKGFRVGNVETYDKDVESKAFDAAKRFRKEYEKHIDNNTLDLFDPDKYLNWRITVYQEESIRN